MIIHELLKQGTVTFTRRGIEVEKYENYKERIHSYFHKDNYIQIYSYHEMKSVQLKYVLVRSLRV